MATSSRTKKKTSAGSPILTKPLPTDDQLDPADAELRQRLGLRPRLYVDETEKGTHPDQRPCPSWCWIADSEYAHEVLEEKPFIAMHQTAGAVTFPAQRYRGRAHWNAATNLRQVETASLEVDMRQPGQSPPEVSVYLRYYDDDREPVFEKVLTLSLTDATELATALAYWVAVAEADLMAKEAGA